MPADAMSFSTTGPDAKYVPYVASGSGAYRKPIVVASPNFERNRLANEWTWNNLRNGTNNLANPNPYGNGSSMTYKWY
jgi:hypothetical protein